MLTLVSVWALFLNIPLSTWRRLQYNRSSCHRPKHEQKTELSHVTKLNTYNLPDLVRPQVALPVLHISDDFVGLLTHFPHVQLGLVAVAFMDMVVQAAPAAVTEALRDEQACPPPRSLSTHRLQHAECGASDSRYHADARRHVCLVVTVAFTECRNNGFDVNSCSIVHYMHLNRFAFELMEEMLWILNPHIFGLVLE